MQAFSPRHTQSPLCGLSLLLLIAHFVLVEPIEGVYCSTASAPYVSALRLRRSNPVPSASKCCAEKTADWSSFFCLRMLSFSASTMDNGEGLHSDTDTKTKQTTEIQSSALHRDLAEREGLATAQTKVCSV